MTNETRQARSPRYRVALADDGAFLITDRLAIHKRTARYYPASFVSGCMYYDERTARYPDYVHAELWRLHDADREQLWQANRHKPGIQTTNVSDGAHITLSGKSVRVENTLIEHVDY